ncbi:helix-turn-helix domain-containing protein [Geodermatophilus amargosae]|uniref:helix-turn-helix domain-containing protein n=1 Tax=Geodermatophilus amargosae TaxID=1296565 RepID=UPI0034DE37C5
MARPTSPRSATPQASAHGHPSHGAPAQLLTIGQASEYLGTGQRFVRRLISERRIAYVKLGKHVRLERCALDAFVAAGRVPCR